MPIWRGGSVIRVNGVSKDYHTERGQWHRVLRGVSLTVAPGDKVALLGRNGAGKSTLIRLIAGIEVPTEGTIERTMSVSWPVGLEGGVGGTMTGNDNVRFMARLYNKPFKDVLEFVEDFAQLGRFMSEPVNTYSTGMRGRLNFALSFAIDFDCYLIDEVIAAGDARFQRRSQEEVFEKRKNRSMILASHIPAIVKQYCTHALVLHRGIAKLFTDLDLAADIYDDL